MRFLAQADDGARAACSPFKPIEASTKCVDLFCRCLGHGYSNRIATIICWKVKSLHFFLRHSLKYCSQSVSWLHIDYWLFSNQYVAASTFYRPFHSSSPMPMLSLLLHSCHTSIQPCRITHHRPHIVSLSNPFSPLTTSTNENPFARLNLPSELICPR